MKNHKSKEHNKYISHEGIPHSNGVLCLFGETTTDHDDNLGSLLLEYENTIRSYLSAIDKLIEPLKEKELNSSDDVISMPLLFLFSHSLELCFKALLFSFLKLSQIDDGVFRLTPELSKEIENNLEKHKLKSFFDLTKKILIHVRDQSIFKISDSLDKMMLDFNSYDINSVESRYTFDRSGKHYKLHDIARLNIYIFNIRKEIDDLFYKVLKVMDCIP